MSDISIKSENVTMKFGPKTVLNEFNFVVSKGDMLFLAGENGSGKTTWIRIATGMLKPTDGRVSFSNKSVNEIRSKLSVVLDEPPIYDKFNGYDNIKLISGLNKFDSNLKKNVLEALNIDANFLKLKGADYSLGQRHRLYVASALLRNPEYLILDEPTIGLDVNSWQMIKSCLIESVKNGTTIILTGQDFALMDEIVNRIVVLKNGKNVFQGDKNTLKGKFNFVVKVESKHTNELETRFKENKVNNHILNSNIEFLCNSKQEALSLVKGIQNSDIPIEDFSLVEVSLQQAFKYIISEAS